MSFSWTSGLSIVIFCIATLVFAVAIMGLFGGNQMPVDGKTVLITGASEGMGLCVAKRLSAKGASIIIVARNVSKLEAAVAEIKAAAKNPNTQRFHYIAADVAEPSYAGPLLADAIAWNNGQALDIVWCIAGMSTPELFLDMEMPSMRRQMDINFFGTAEMCHSILQHWLAPDAPVEKEAKHLIMTSSVAAFYNVPGYIPYAPAKWAMRGFAEGLAQEVMLYPQNVKVHVVYPGTILTAGYDREMETKPEITTILEADDPKQTPDVVARRAIEGLESGNHSVTVAWLGELMRFGAIGGSFRNNWVVDIIGAWLVQLIWIFVHFDLHGKIRKYGKTHGHPSTYQKGKLP